MTPPDISLILPVHNQGDHIDGVVRSYLDVFARLRSRSEIVLVTNACSDDSVAVCTALAGELAPVRHIDLGREGGWGRAVKAGLAASEGRLLAYTNSARTTPEILTLTMAYASAYPEVVVKANRRIRESLRRRLGSLLYNLQCRALFDLAVWDVNGTPKVFPRSFAGLLELDSDDDLIDVEFIASCVERGYPIVEVPVLATIRHGGRSTTNYRSALRMYVGAARLRRRRSLP